MKKRKKRNEDEISIATFALVSCSSTRLLCCEKNSYNLAVVFFEHSMGYTGRNVDIPGLR